MPDEPKIVGRFAFGITLYRHPDGRIEYSTQSRNKGIAERELCERSRKQLPTEIILMQLRAFLRNQENDYFDKYDKSMSKFSDEDDK